MSYIQEEKGPRVDPLKEEVFFNQVFVQDGDVIWPNGYDLNPAFKIKHLPCPNPYRVRVNHIGCSTS